MFALFAAVLGFCLEEDGCVSLLVGLWFIYLFVLLNILSDVLFRFLKQEITGTLIYVISAFFLVNV